MKLAYYNEHDPKAAEWLKRLVDRGMIAPGVVDSRDIQDVCPTELMGYCQVHLFAGIGGWSLALRLAGWPDDRPIWTGSCPCQPFSSAGKKKGKNDERHLFPHMLRLIATCRPATIVGEQVASPDGRQWLAEVQEGVEKIEYWRRFYENLQLLQEAEAINVFQNVCRPIFRWPTTVVQDLPAFLRARLEGIKKRTAAAQTRETSRQREGVQAGVRREEQGAPAGDAGRSAVQEETTGFRSGQTHSGDRGPHQEGGLRDVGSPLQSAQQRNELGLAFLGSNRPEEGVSVHQHSGSVLGNERRSESLGRGPSEIVDDRLAKQEMTNEQRDLAESFRVLLSQETQHRVVDGVQASVEALGYQFAAADLPACGVGAAHIRQRLYWLAHSPERGRLTDDLPQAAGSGSLGDSRMAHAKHQPTRAGEPGEQGRARIGRDRLAEHGEVGDGLAHPDELRREGQVGSRGNRVAGSDERGNFWEPYDLVECRDPRGGPNVLRRVEPRTQQMVDGLSLRMERMLPGFLSDLWSEVQTYADAEESDPQEALRDVRSVLLAEVVAGRTLLPETAVLLAFLRELQRQRGPFQNSLACACPEVSQRSLLGLRGNPSSLCASCRSRLDEQHTLKHPNLVQAVSSVLARSAYTVWAEDIEKNAADTFPLAKGVKNRTTLLKGYGNAIVPPLAAEFMQAVMEII